MFGESNKQNPLPEYSLYLDPDFSYINLLHQDLKYAKRSHLKVQSKIGRSTKSKEKCNYKRPKDFQTKNRTQSRKKSKTSQRSPEKSKKSNKKLVETNSLKQRKGEKLINPRCTQGKSKSIKSLKTIILKRPSQQSVFKRQSFGQKNLKPKLEASKKTYKTYKTFKQKHKKSNKLQKTKSQTALEFITISQISKKPIVGSKQSRVFHEYFGMEDKLSSIIEKDGKSKSNFSKLSKCKTHSSSVSMKKQGKIRNYRPKK